MEDVPEHIVDDFMRKLEVGQTFEQYVADQFCAEGIPAVATQTPLERTVNEGQWSKYADQRDITVAGRWRVEVKSRKYSFTSKDDYPFYPVMVNKVASWDAKTKKPLAVIVVSQVTRSMFVVPAKSEPHWEKNTRPDRARGYSVLNYECPKQYLRTWDDLVSWFKMKLEAP